MFSFANTTILFVSEFPNIRFYWLGLLEHQDKVQYEMGSSLENGGRLMKSSTHQKPVWLKKNRRFAKQCPNGRFLTRLTTTRIVRSSSILRRTDETFVSAEMKIWDSHPRLMMEWIETSLEADDRVQKVPSWRTTVSVNMVIGQARLLLEYLHCHQDAQSIVLSYTKQSCL